MFKKRELIIALRIYILLWVLVMGFLSIYLLRFSSVKETKDSLVELLTDIPFLVAVQILFVLVYLCFLLVRYFIRMYRSRGAQYMSKRLVLGVILPVVLVIGVLKTIIYINGDEDFDYTWDHTVENTSGIATNHYQTDGKHRGMSVFGWTHNNEGRIDPLIQNNIEWIAVIPFLYQKDERTVAMRTPEAIGQWSRRDSVFLSTITELRDKGLHVQLKPHLWTRDGWRSNINQQSDKDWDLWFDSYRKNMLHYATMAQQTEVELLCIGTELRTSLKHQPDRWAALVKEIKAIYGGKLTYAANWDGEYKLIDFWDQLDYIGLQAYFPLTQKTNPDLATLQQGWEQHIPMLKSLSQEHNRPILFTEVGYKSEAAAAIKPWEWGSYLSIFYQKKSDRTQQLAYQALFDQLWNEDWFAGMYIWQWNTRTEKPDAKNSLNFSPRFKPAQNTIAREYGR